MSGKINIYSDQWVDIVFQNKNKLYGAYDMRKTSSKRHARALFIAISVFLVAIISPILIKKFASNKRDQYTGLTELKNLKLDQPKKEEIKLETPPPPKRNTVQYVPPVITKDELVEDEKPPIVENIIEAKSAVGTTDVKDGTDNPTVPIEDTKIIENEEPFAVVEQMPEFEGGERALMNFISSNIRYPTIALESGVSGVVVVRFVVDKNGHVTQGTVVRGIGSGCDEEALRILKKMPPWKAGKQGGRAVPVLFTLPIRFALQ